MEYSIYQKKIIDYFNDKDGENIYVNALAGSGKSFILCELLNKTDMYSAYVAFNNHIKAEMEKKITNSNVKVFTLHGVGLQIIKKNMETQCKIATLDTYGNYIKDILKDIIPFDRETRQNWLQKQFVINEFYRLYGLIRLNFLQDDGFNDYEKTLSKIMSDYELFVSPEFKVNLTHTQKIEVIKELTNKAIESFKDNGSFDFTDMLYLPLYFLFKKEWKVPTYLRFDVLACDEIQDFSKSQALLTVFLKKEKSKVILVGDKNQAIYYFNGACPAALNLLKKLHSPIKEFELPINYRCPISHLKQVNTLYSIPIQPSPMAIQGEIFTINESELLTTVQEGDMIIGRKNKWIISISRKLLAKGKPVFLKDKEYITKLEGMLRQFDNKRYNYIENEIAKKKNKLAKFLSQSSEKQDSNKILALKQQIEDYESLVELKSFYLNENNYISLVQFKEKFSKLCQSKDLSKCIYLSSIHGVKGLETDRVFILNENKIDYNLSNNHEQKKQEKNLAYIAATRAKKTLFLISGDGTGAIFDETQIEETPDFF